MNPHLMRFDPATGAERPYPSHAAQWRDYHGKMAWLVNPYTGDRRKAEDVGLDPFGLLLADPPLRDSANRREILDGSTVPVSREALEALRDLAGEFTKACKEILKNVA